MPTYGYRCKNGHEFEVVQTFAEAPIKRCKVCGSRVNRIFYPVGIVFKGPGFYATDSRTSQPVASSSERGEKSESDGKTDTADVKPAKTEGKGGEGKTKAKPNPNPKSGSSSKKS